MPEIASARRLTVDVRSPDLNVSTPVDTPDVDRLNDTDMLVPAFAAAAVMVDCCSVKSLPLSVTVTGDVRFMPFTSMAREMV